MSNIAFIGVYKEFLEELGKTLPEEKMEYDNILREAESDKKYVKGFLKMIGESNWIVNKDSKIMNSNKNVLVVKLKLNKYWSTLSENTQNAIWEYLNTLYVLGSTLSNIPDELMGAIESVAKQCAENANNVDNDMGDMGNLFAGMQNMLGNMMKQQNKD